MPLNSVDQDAAAGLWDECDPPCVSLFQPTHRNHPDNQQDPIRFKNLLIAIGYPYCRGGCGHWLSVPVYQVQSGRRCTDEPPGWRLGGLVE